MKVTRKEAAIIEDLAAQTVENIYQKLGGLTDHTVQVTFDEPNARIVLTFSDGSTIAVDMSQHLAVLEAVHQAGGTFLVYAPNPGGAQAANGGGGPLPDMMCPCGGP